MRQLGMVAIMPDASGWTVDQGGFLLFVKAREAMAVAVDYASVRSASVGSRVCFLARCGPTLLPAQFVYLCWHTIA
jgi:hypothetical protein